MTHLKTRQGQKLDMRTDRKLNNRTGRSLYNRNYQKLRQGKVKRLDKVSEEERIGQTWIENLNYISEKYAENPN